MADTENTTAPKKEGRPVITRRALCVGLGGTAALLGLGAVRYAGSAPLVRPPGGQDEEALVSACIRCEKCYEVCPRGVIAPAHLEDGILNMRTPVRPRPLSQDRNSRQHSADSVKPSAAPITSR